MVLALQFQNQTLAVYQLCKPDRNGHRAGATAVSARSTRDDRVIGLFSFSRGPLTPALSSHSLPFVPQPRTLTPDDGDGDGGGCWCGCGSTAPNIPRAGTRSSRRLAAVAAEERLGGGRCGRHRGLVRLRARVLQLPLLSNALLLLVAILFFWAKSASLLNRLA